MEVTQTRIITEEDLMRLDADQWMEVIDGKLISTDRAATEFSLVFIIDNLFSLLNSIVSKNKLGRVHTDGVTYIVRQDKKKGIRDAPIPDFSFVSKDRIPPKHRWSRPFQGAPDLAVEVTSPGQTVDNLQTKIHLYLETGSEQVWVLHSPTQELYQYRRDDPSIVRVYRGEDEVDTFGMFPGLKLIVRDLFEGEEEPDDEE